MYLASPANGDPNASFYSKELSKLLSDDSIQSDINRFIEARRLLSELESQPQDLWDSWLENRSLRGCHQAFQYAYTIVAHAPHEASMMTTERAAITFIDGWMREERYHTKLRQIAQELRPLSLAWTPSDLLKPLPVPISKLADAAKKGSAS